MAERRLEPVKIGDEIIYVEVSDIEGKPEAPSPYERTSTEGEISDAGEQIRSTIAALSAQVTEALAASPPAEWTLEINIGFKGKAGIPFITEGEANGAVKLSAKWIGKP